MNNENYTNSRISILLVGCQLDSGNGGVTALGYSAISNIIKCNPNIKIYIQSNTGKEQQQVIAINGRLVDLKLVFFHSSKRIREKQGLKLIQLLSSLVVKLPISIRQIIGRHIYLFNALDQVDAVLDVSGGDSFTSIYGDVGFDAIVAIKKIAINFKKPLYLLPQSYGPFLSASHIDAASHILNNARLISCRDSHGKSTLLNQFSSLSDKKIIDSPDMAFQMESDNEVISSLRVRYKGKSIVGLNISGLLYFQGQKFNLASEYKNIVVNFIEWILSTTEAYIILIPHVISTKKQQFVAENTDNDAINEILKTFSGSTAERISVADDYSDPRKIKGVIGACDYFVGARMHACIGAISQEVPTRCLAYSDKFFGVMQMVGKDHTVIDLRKFGLEDVMVRLTQGFTEAFDKNSESCSKTISYEPVASVFEKIIQDVYLLKNKVKILD